MRDFIHSGLDLAAFILDLCGEKKAMDILDAISRNFGQL